MLLVSFISARTGDDKIQRLIGAWEIANSRERFDQQFTAFLFMQTTQEEQKPPAAELRKAVEEILARARKIDFRCRCSVIHDHFIASVEGKGFASQTPFLLNTNPNSRGSDLHIGRGTITASTPNSCLAWIENSTGNTINGLTGTASNGITIDAGGGDSVTNTQVTATGTADGTFAYAVGAGGGEHEIGVIFRGNRGQLTAPGWGPSPGGSGHGYGFINMSPANSGIDVDGSNSVGANGAGFVPRAGF
jgi:hypothetical protein